MGGKVKFFLMADQGYPPYGSTMVTTNPMVEKNPQVVQAFVKASLEGWKSYLQDPAPANKLIQRDNPKMTDDRIAFAIKTLKEIDAVGRGDAKTHGIGVMTADRWKSTYEFLTQAGLLKPSTDWKKAFTTRFVDNLHIMMA
jgi:NitT/TauT family transport system substrate-binding protein